LRDRSIHLLEYIFPFVDSIGRINFRILAKTARTPGVPWASWSPSRARVEKVKEVEVEVEGQAPKERTKGRKRESSVAD